MAELLSELQQNLQDESMAVEVAIAETGLGDLAQDLHNLMEDLTQLAITRDTIRRVI